jgi:sugar lactone lactonase YvrE
VTESGDRNIVIDSISPLLAIPGGDVQVRGRSFLDGPRPTVRIGDEIAQLTAGSDRLAIARVPEQPGSHSLTVGRFPETWAETPFETGSLIADNLHPVANPAIDARGNIYVTFSGSRGQKTPVAVYRIPASASDSEGMEPYLTDLMNATGLAFDSLGVLHVSSRFDGFIYQSPASGVLSVFVEGMGVATGIAFDLEDNLYVGDRSGTIFKISPTREVYVFATVEASIAAFHLAFGPGGYLYVSGPTTSSNDAVHRISPAGDVEVFYRGLGRPQGLAFDVDGNLYVAASLAGRRGIVRITPDGAPSLFLSGPNIVGLAFAPGGGMIVATTSALYRVHAGVTGRPLV